MQFRTQIPISKYEFPIDYNSKIMSLGSCFAENMAEKFEYYKFQNAVNPFGIIFNVISIERIVERIVNLEFFTEKDIFYHNDMWYCYEVHSCLSNLDKDKFLQSLNSVLKLINQQLIDSTHIIITYGTSWVYRNIETNQIVANCHKISQKYFSKELVSVEIMQKSIESIINLIQKINPNCHFIFTVSPVRHIKDGFVENNVSKSQLISAIYSLNYQLQTTNYFPSYEIMMDELRDYRFYTQDMLHPSQTAIDYIWERFKETYINDSEFETMKQVCDIQKALQHKPFNSNSESYQQFLVNVHKKIAFIQEKHHHIQL